MRSSPGASLLLAKPGGPVLRRFRALLPCLLTAIACKDQTNEITRPSDPNRGLFVSCAPAGANISCIAYVTGREFRNVSSEASWMASDPSVGNFVEPGIFAPTRSGEIGLWARHEDLLSLQRWFFVSPGEAARYLVSLDGFVMDEATGARIAGAQVAILDGHSRGARATTESSGRYAFPRILSGEVFSITASKEGYEPSTKLHRVAFPFDPGAAPHLDFLLRRSN